MLAHEVPEVLPVAPWPGVAVAVLLLVGLWLPSAPRAGAVTTGASLLAGRRTAWVAAVVALALAAVARTGPEGELDNPVPPLVVGLAWPLLFVLPLALRARRAEPVPHVWPAAAAAVAVAGYLSLVPDRTTPRVLAAALASYLLAQLAVGLALGRGAVGRTEVLGLIARWTSLGPALPRWAPPPGAAVVLAAVLAGAWCERLQRSPEAPGTLVVAVGSAVVAAALAAGLARAGALPALLPVAAAAVVAGGLRRALISAQLLVDADRVVADPLGVRGGQLAALAVVAVGGCLAAAVVARRTPAGTSRLPALGLVSAGTFASVWVVLTH